MGNVRAMESAMHQGSLDVSGILAMHSELLAESAPDHAGRLRTEQVWIGGSGYGPHQVEFVPPHHERVGGALRVDRLELGVHESGVYQHGNVVASRELDQITQRSPPACSTTPRATALI